MVKHFIYPRSVIIRRLLVVMCLLGITSAFSSYVYAYHLGDTSPDVIESHFNRPLFDVVSVLSERSVGQNITREKSFIEALSASGYVNEGVISTDLYPYGELYYYIEWTNNDGSKIYLRYFPDSPNNCVELSCLTVFPSDLVSLSDFTTNEDGIIDYPFEFILYTAH